MNRLQKFLQIIEATIGDEKDVEVYMKAAAGVIVRQNESGNNEVLLIQRSADDHWPLHFEFPRGKCDRPIGEDVVHCAKREIKEETGLDVNVLRLLDKFEYLADGGTRKTTCYNFLCTMKDPTQKVKLSKEHEGYKWISQMGEAELLVLPDQQKTLEMVLSKENPISTTPTNDFTKNNQIEEASMNKILENYLLILQEERLEEITADVNWAGDVVLTMSKGGFAVRATIAAAAIIAVALKGVQYLQTDKKCRSYKYGSIPWRICHKQVRIENEKRKIDSIKKQSKLCRFSKDPKKCMDKINEKIKNMKNIIDKNQAEIDQLKPLVKY